MNKVNIKIILETDEPRSISNREITEILQEALFKLDTKLTSSLEIEIIFVDEDRIRRLNKQSRQIDQPTDVLSFPQNQLETGKLNILGSITICLAKVSEKEEDLRDVLKHGLLHLLGFDHETDLKKWEWAAKEIGCDL